MRRQKYEYNVDLFNSWSRPLAYILGFLTADGYINTDVGYITFNISEKDMEILKYLRDKISPNNIIRQHKTFLAKYNKEYNMIRLIIHSRYITDILLNKYGICQKKTGKEMVPFDLPQEFVGDYIRGIFDGDGHVSSDKYHRLYSEICSASLEFLQQLCCLCGNIGKINICKKKWNGEERISWNWKMCIADSIKLKNIMYNNEEFSLIRKKKVFFDFNQPFRLYKKRINKE